MEEKNSKLPELPQQEMNGENVDFIPQVNKEFPNSELSINLNLDSNTDSDDSDNESDIPLEDQLNREDFHDEDYDPELEEDPEKITCEQCEGHGEYDNSICEICDGMGYVLRNELITDIDLSGKINKELLIGIVVILREMSKGLYESSINKNDLARKSLMNASASANELYTKIFQELKVKEE